jgi:arylsulfatase A-like enzyme
MDIDPKPRRITMRKGQISRRDILKAFGWGVTTLTLTPWTGSCKKPVQSKNVLFIAVDDLNDWANCLGGRPGVQTPNLDRLASRGVLFTNAHCAAPACNPSRTSVFTGISPSSSGIYFNRQYWRESPVLEKAETIPEYFRSQGYISIGCGKLFHCLSWIRISYGRDGNDPNVWDSYFPSKTRPMPDFVWPLDAMKDEFETITWTPLAGAGTERRPPYYFDWGPLAEGDENTSDFKVVDWAAKEIQKKHDKPFFLAAGIFRPHIPWFVPKKYFDLYPLEDIFLPEIQENDLEDCSAVGKSFCRREWQKWILRNNQWKPALQAYLASISFADAQLGHLIDALDRSGHAQDTIVVLWSDHGMHIGEKEHWEGKITRCGMRTSIDTNQKDIFMWPIPIVMLPLELNPQLPFNSSNGS